MQQLNIDDECPCFLGERGKPLMPVLTNYAGRLRPTSVMVKPDGATNDDPSFAIAMVDPERKVMYVAEISLAKMMPAIEAALLARRTE